MPPCHATLPAIRCHYGCHASLRCAGAQPERALSAAIAARCCILMLRRGSIADTPTAYASAIFGAASIAAASRRGRRSGASQAIQPQPGKMPKYAMSASPQI